MCTIGENIEENIKNELNYTGEPDTDNRKRFDRLKSLCLIHNIPMKLNRHFIDGIKIFLYHTDEENGQYYWGKPFIRRNKIYIRFRGLNNLTVDAAKVDVFGSIHKLD